MPCNTFCQGFITYAKSSDSRLNAFRRDGISCVSRRNVASERNRRKFYKLAYSTRIPFLLCSISSLIDGFVGNVGDNLFIFMATKGEERRLYLQFMKTWIYVNFFVLHSLSSFHITADVDDRFSYSLPKFGSNFAEISFILNIWCIEIKNRLTHILGALNSNKLY